MLEKVFILLIIVSIKAIFSAADTAFTYVNKFKISQESKTNLKAKKIKKIIDNKPRLFGIIEVGITIAELFATAFAVEVFVGELKNALINVNVSKNVAITYSIIIITIILSYIMLVFGALLPKKIARNNPEKTAYSLINILQLLVFLNMPFEKFINFSIKIFSKVFGIKDNPEDKLSEKEIKMIITEGKEQGIVEKIEKQIAINALKFNSTAVKNVMIPKEKINFINIKDKSEKILKEIQKSKHTRIPVFEGNKDNIIGLFNIKDLILEYAKEQKIDLDLNKILRKVIIVSKEEKISSVFKTMQLNNQPMVIVEDDNKKVVGLVTIEDILEKLVGKIFDEYDS